jgi:hypothetical protein
MTDTANLQSHQLRLTVKQIANLWNVSERMIYSARELIRTGREDIIAEVMAGRLKMHPALKLAKPEKYGDGRNYRPGDDAYSALVRAWNRCSDDERSLFTARLLAQMRAQDTPPQMNRTAPAIRAVQPQGRRS